MKSDVSYRRRVKGRLIPVVDDQVIEVLDALPWIEVRPGVFRKELGSYIARKWACQDCGILSPRMVVLGDGLWRSLYPENGVACKDCIEKRLGRPLTKQDLDMKARCNEYWQIHSVYG